MFAMGTRDILQVLALVVTWASQAAAHSALKLADLPQGAQFTKCIKIQDWHTKGPEENVEVVEREPSTRCCPSGYLPGHSVSLMAGDSNSGKYDTHRLFGMVSCGWKHDGSVMNAWKLTGICDYGRCHVVKRFMNCADGSSLQINGCCKGEYGSRCLAHKQNMSVNLEVSESCSTEKSRKVGVKYKKGTKAKDDDISDGDLMVENVRRYEMCETIAATETASFRMLSSGSGGSGATTTTTIDPNATDAASGSYLEAETSSAFYPGWALLAVANFLIFV
eukprot:gnl/MRDRNA2_/MRDRNA2_82771_c0_seq1.p1 gnl/MRDRNA2_/MRDRNA2_82771_c0~~gnl/MRDRNA2_/MRDRNA2_82771_c0_seq1.p1  ORF type:complete len:278 (+),score=54.26 gnl/MRDRNA2_/MRDRNA2_82771_c0_seq1:44-877(+)